MYFENNYHTLLKINEERNKKSIVLPHLVQETSQTRRPKFTAILMPVSRQQITQGHEND